MSERATNEQLAKEAADWDSGKLTPAGWTPVRKLVSQHICMTKDIGGNGNLFGGIMLSWLDCAGAITAMTYASSQRMVTLKMSEVLFKKPIKTHDVVRIYASIVKVGRTSVTIKLQAVTVHLESHAEEEVVVTEMVFVQVDENGHSVPLKED